MMKKIFSILGVMAVGMPAFGQTNTTVDQSLDSGWHEVFTLAGTPEDLGKNQVLSDAFGIQKETQSFKLYTSEKWMLNLDLTTRPELEDESQKTVREQASAKAYFRVSPSWTVGGTVSVGMQELDNTSEWDDQRLQAGIRLESAFRF